jgi:effector-binding domain-containing protein
MFKKILIGLLGLIVVLVIIGFILPGKMVVSRSMVIQAPAEYVFEEVNDVEKNQNWSYWNTLYKDMKVTYGDVKSGVGASYNWEGEESGNGKLTITESIPATSIKEELDFMEQGTAQAWYTFEPEGEGTKVTTGFETDFGMNPFMRLMGSLLMKGEMEKAFDHNLTRLKEIAEAKPKFTVKITEENTTPVSYVGIGSTLGIEDMNAINAQMGKSFTELATALQKSKVQMTGPAFCLYPRWDEEKKEMDMVCAFPVAADAKLPAKYPVKKTDGGLAVKAIHSGDYNNLKSTHDQVNQYIQFKKLQIVGAPWEVYVTDPTVEKDTTKWVTEVYYPVAKQ